MAHITLARSWSLAPVVARPGWLYALDHRVEVLRRRARRNRYLAITGRSPQRYPWFATMVIGISGR